MDSRFIKVAACAISIVFASLNSSSAQSVSARDACFAKLPPSAFARVPVLIDTAPVDSAAEKVLPAADILTQIVTEHIRKSLGSETGPLPNADSAVKWLQLGGAVLVTVHHDGTFTWIRDASAIPGFMGAGELNRLANALDESAKAGERVFWPDGANEDSLSFRLFFVSPLVRPDMKLEPVKVRVANPVFTISMPWFKSAELTKEPRIDYPIRAERNKEGQVILDFVVDSLGHVDPASVKEYLPPGSKFGPGDRDYYQAFLNAVMRGLPSGEFKPATVGGCPLNQHVRQTFKFNLASQ